MTPTPANDFGVKAKRDPIRCRFGILAVEYGRGTQCQNMTVHASGFCRNHVSPTWAEDQRKRRKLQADWEKFLKRQVKVKRD